MLGVGVQEVSADCRGQDGPFLPVFLEENIILFSFLPQIFIEHLLGVRHCFRNFRLRSEQSSTLLTCSCEAYSLVGDRWINNKHVLEATGAVRK